MTVSADSSISELLTFVSLDRYNDGFLFTFEEAMPIIAIYDGLVVFTGHTKYNGKTISVLYDDRYDRYIWVCRSIFSIALYCDC